MIGQVQILSDAQLGLRLSIQEPIVAMSAGGTTVVPEGGIAGVPPVMVW
jgi:hypothetical protein